MQGSGATAPSYVGKHSLDRSDSTSTSLSPPKNTTLFSANREVVVEFVDGLLQKESGTRSITITGPDTFGGFYVSCVTKESSAPVPLTF